MLSIIEDIKNEFNVDRIVFYTSFGEVEENTISRSIKIDDGNEITVLSLRITPYDDYVRVVKMEANTVVKTDWPEGE